MWRVIMDEIAEMEGQDPERNWEEPEGITKVTLCQVTNQLAGPDCPESTDLCASDSIPEKRCGGHETIELCNETHMLATNTCPDKTKFVVQKKENGEKILIGATFDYEQINLITPCTTHPAAPETTTITTSAGPGGSITPSANVELGQDFTVYISPSAGYSIADVVVDGVSVGPVSSYTFTAVNEVHTISATFAGGGEQPEPDPQPDPEPDPEPVVETPANNASLPMDKLVDVQKNSSGGGTLIFKSGRTVKFKAIKNMTATAYNKNEPKVGTITASGTKVHKGVVAVDRRVIKLGTKMYIVASGGYEYGYSVAEDTGVFGNVIDLYFESYSGMQQFGRRSCTVYILE